MFMCVCKTEPVREQQQAREQEREREQEPGIYSLRMRECVRACVCGRYVKTRMWVSVRGSVRGTEGLSEAKRREEKREKVYMCESIRKEIYTCMPDEKGQYVFVHMVQIFKHAA